MKRRKFSSDFKAKVVLELLQERETAQALAKKYEVHPQQLSNWKRQALSNFSELFSGKAPDPKEEAQKEKDELLRTIGQLQVENNFLKKNLK